eukprot:217271_1
MIHNAQLLVITKLTLYSKFTMTNIIDIVEPILKNKTGYVADLEFISNKRSKEIVKVLSTQPKVNPGTMHGLNGAFSIDSLRNAKSRMPGYPPFNTHQNYGLFGPPGCGKSSPVDYLSGPYQQSRGNTMKYGLQKGCISASEHRQYNRALIYKDKDNTNKNTNTNSNSESVILSQNEEEHALNNEIEDEKQYINNIIGEVDKDLENIKNGDHTINSEEQKILLCAYKQSTFVNAVRSRRLNEDVANRFGNGMGLFTEYTTMVNGLNSNNNNEFELIWCTMADNKINPKDFTGKNYCVKEIKQNQFQFLVMGTIRDFIDFLGYINSGTVSRADIYILDKFSRYFYENMQLKQNPTIIATWIKYQTALQIISTYERVQIVEIEEDIDEIPQLNNQITIKIKQEP